MGQANEKTLLILGSPRSGTTLLSAMLGCHPDIAILNEDLSGSCFKLLSKRIRGNKLCVPNQIELEHTGFRVASNFFLSRCNSVRVRIERQFGLPTTRSLSRMSKLSIRDYEERTDNLHIIGTLRDPSQVVRSITKRGRQTNETAEFRWKRSVEVLYKLSRERKSSTGFSVVQFDKLVSKPDAVMRRCLRQLGCDFREEVLEGYLHTPQYGGNKKIDENKASASTNAYSEYSLLKEDQELMEKYISLLNQSL